MNNLEIRKTEVEIQERELSILEKQQASSWKLANYYAKTELVPAQYRGKPENCFIALDMANRMKAHPIAIMQNLYVVNGRPAWSSQFQLTLFNNCQSKYSDLEVEYFGEKGKDSYGARAHAKNIKTGELIKGPDVTIAMAKAEGWYDKKSREGVNISKWPTMTELMLHYRAQSFFIRTRCPEVLNGFYTSDEISDIKEAEIVDVIAIEEGKIIKEIEVEANTVEFEKEVEKEVEKEKTIEELDSSDVGF